MSTAGYIYKLNVLKRPEKAYSYTFDLIVVNNVIRKQNQFNEVQITNYLALKIKELFVCKLSSETRSNQKIFPNFCPKTTVSFTMLAQKQQEIRN